MLASGIAGIVADVRAEIVACRLCPGLEPWVKRDPQSCGNSSSRYMVVGQTPGCFAVLREVMGEVGCALEDLFYLAEAARCRPPSGRAPTRTECRTCRPFLRFEMRALRPRLVLAFGALAAESALGRPVKIEQEHGYRHWVQDTEVLTLLLPSSGNRASLGRLGMKLEDYRRWLVELIRPIRDEHVRLVRP